MRGHSKRTVTTIEKQYLLSGVKSGLEREKALVHVGGRVENSCLLIRLGQPRQLREMAAACDTGLEWRYPKIG